MGKNPEVKPKNTKITAAELTREEKDAHVLKALRAACPRILSIDTDYDEMKVDVFVPPPANTDPRATLAQREFLAESGVTKVERATIDYICSVSLKAIAGGELTPTIRLYVPAPLETVTA